MKSFNDVIGEQIALLEADPNLDPNLGGVPPDPSGAPGGIGEPGLEGPPPGEEMPAEPEEPKPLTSEGARYLTDLALKALAFDPNNMSPQDKEIFTDDVTAENAQDMLERIQQILGGSGE